MYLTHEFESYLKTKKQAALGTVKLHLQPTSKQMCTTPVLVSTTHQKLNAPHVSKISFSKRDFQKILATEKYPR